MVEGKSGRLFYEGFEPIKRGVAFDATEGYFDRNFGERTLYMAAKALNGNQRERVIFTPHLFSALNLREMVHSAAGGYLIKNDPSVEAGDLVMMTDLALLERCLTSGEYINSAESMESRGGGGICTPGMKC